MHVDVSESQAKEAQGEGNISETGDHPGRTIKQKFIHQVKIPRVQGRGNLAQNLLTSWRHKITSLSMCHPTIDKDQIFHLRSMVLLPGEIGNKRGPAVWGPRMGGGPNQQGCTKTRRAG